MKMKIVSKCTIASLALIFQGCTTGNWYQPPTGSDIAQLTVKTSDDKFFNIGMVSYENETYLESQGVVVAILNSKIPTYKYTNQITVPVKSNTEFRFSLKTGGVDSAKWTGPTIELSSHVCQTHNGFVPKTGKSYVAIHEAGSSGCKVKIYESKSDGTLESVIDAKNYKSCLDPKLTGSLFKQYFCPAAGFNFR
jgi:hypothetical protein